MRNKKENIAHTLTMPRDPGHTDDTNVNCLCVFNKDTLPS